MSHYEQLSIIISTVQSIVLLVVLIVYARQLMAMQRQVETVRQVALGQNLLALFNFLQNEDVRDARRIVLTKLVGRNYSDWNEEEKRAAAKVCSNYSNAGFMTENGLVPPVLLIEHWGQSICRCYAILHEYITDLRHNMGPEYLAPFERLNEKAVLRWKIYPSDTSQPNA